MEDQRMGHIQDLGSDAEVPVESYLAIARSLDGDAFGKYRRFIMAALGSIPWVGGVIAALAAVESETRQARRNRLHDGWLEEHRSRIARLTDLISDILTRLNTFGPAIDERVNSDQYLDLVRKGFRTWDHADTDEKRDLVRKLLSNACASDICSDDVVRLFIDWLDHYHEIHFAVIRKAYQRPGSSRGAIWRSLRGARVREDSAEADLFKLIIRDLSTGGVIRQHRETTYDGRFVSKHRSPGHRPGGTMVSAFDETEPYELTELGRQFVHYCMEEVVPRIAGETRSQEE